MGDNRVTMRTTNVNSDSADATHVKSVGDDVNSNEGVALDVPEFDTIVRSECLCYVTCKMNVMTKNDIVKLVSDFYDFECINNAVETVYKYVPGSLGFPRKKTRQGEKRCNQAASDLYDVLEMCQSRKVDLPQFAAVDLSNMPAVDIDRIDAASLAMQLSKVRHAMKSSGASGPADDSTDLKEMSETLKQLKEGIARLSKDMENVKQGRESGPSKKATLLADIVKSNPAEVSMPAKVRPVQSGTQANSQIRTGEAPFQEVIRRRNNRRKSVPVVTGTRERGDASRAVDQKQRRQIGKYTSIFATRFREDVTAEMVLQDLSDAGIETNALQCDQLKTRHEGYASFRVHGRCPDPDALLRPDVWDKDIFVKWYYIKRSRNPGSESGTGSGNASSGINPNASEPEVPQDDSLENTIHP